MDVTLSRGGTSVALPIDASGGTPLISVDYGKPSLDIRGSGVLNPRHNDQWSGLEQYTLIGRFTSSSAYSNAVSLADLIKSNSDGTPLDVDIPLGDFDDSIKAAPAADQDGALVLSYPPGRRDSVEVDLSLTRVDPDRVNGYTQDASTPTAAGSGPIQLGDGSTTVDLTEGVTVSRSVGRPNATVRRTQQEYPRLTDTHKAAADSFELAFEFTDNAVSTINSLVGVFRQQLGRDSLTLDFQGVFGLGAFNVVPAGASGLRHSRVAGEEGVTLVPSVALRRVQ